MSDIFFTSTKWVSQRDSLAFSHGGLQSHQIPLDPKTKLKKNMNKDVEMVRVPYQQTIGSLMYAMMYLVGLDIPNKQGESTHGQSKLRTLDCNQMHFSIITKYLVIQITIQRITTPRDGWIL
jgi:hypothetical protein